MKIELVMQFNQYEIEHDGNRVKTIKKLLKESNIAYMARSVKAFKKDIDFWESTTNGIKKQIVKTAYIN